RIPRDNAREPGSRAAVSGVLVSDRPTGGAGRKRQALVDNSAPQSRAVILDATSPGAGRHRARSPLPLAEQSSSAESPPGRMARGAARGPPPTPGAAPTAAGRRSPPGSAGG